MQHSLKTTILLIKNTTAKGWMLPVEGGTIPVEGGTIPIEGGTIPVEGGTTPVEGGETGVSTPRRLMSPAVRFQM